MAESSGEEISSEKHEKPGEVPKKGKIRRYKKSQRSIERPRSLELKTDFANTETKLVVLDFLSSQPIERLTARNDPKEKEERKSSIKVNKSSSDASSYESHRSRYAKIAKSARPLRKQYSLRLKKDLDEYLKQRGKSLDDLTYSSDSSAAEEGEPGGLLHQRSYTEGDTYYKKLRSKRTIPGELKKGITEFEAQGLYHVPDKDKSYKTAESRKNRPENLTLAYQTERRLSPVLSPESHVAERLELISQEILTTYPDLFNEQISKVSLQELTYEKFAATAKKVLEKYPGGWTRVALVCYFARELAMEDESTDDQLEHLVDFSSRFISETSAEWIASQGGWGALQDSNETLSPSLVRKKLKEEPDLVDGILTTSKPGWWTYAKYYGVQVTVLALGMTVAYHYHMTK